MDKPEPDSSKFVTHEEVAKLEEAPATPFAIRLRHPINALGQMTEVLTFSKPTLRAIRSWPCGTPAIGDLMDSAAILAGVPDKVINKLEGEDAKAVLEIAQLLVLPFQGTSAES